MCWTHATSYCFSSSDTVQCKGKNEENLIEKYSFPYGLRNPYRNLHSENSQDYAPETSTKLYVQEFGFCKVCIYGDLKGAGVHASE
jgi:hypothetical protein